MLTLVGDITFFSAYDDLVVPLKKSCPQAMKVPNNAGVTPEDLLNWMKQNKEVQAHNTIKDLAAIRVLPWPFRL